MPESEMASLIIELRSATAGVGTFTFSLDHMADTQGAVTLSLPMLYMEAARPA